MGHVPAVSTIAAVLSGDARWCVVDGDCLDVMRGMPDRSVAHVITDPPYDERTHRNAVTAKTDGATGVSFAYLLAEEGGSTLMARRAGQLPLLGS